MKKIFYLIFVSFCFFGGVMFVSAAPTYSFYTSSSVISQGSSVTATIQLKSVASWNLTIKSSGATSGCTQSFADATSNANNTTKYLSVTCKATGVGVINFTVTGDATSQDGSTTMINASKSVSVNPPREKDTNNYLKSIGVTGYTLTPEFNKDVMEYNVEVPNTVDKVTLEASPESGYANISGIGEVEVNEGANVFEIKVTSETGAERIYKVNVNVKDENPINVSIGDANYTIMKNVKNVEAPATYEATTVKIEDMDIPAFYSEVTDFTLVAVKNQTGDVSFAIYNEEKNTYTLYNENKSDQLLLYILPISEEKDGFGKAKVTIDEQSYDTLKADNADVYLVYATNILTGKNAYYVYDQTNNSYTLYDDGLLSSYIDQQEQYKMVILGMGGALIVGILIIAILLLRKPKQKKIKEKTSEKAQEEVIKKKTETKIHSKEEALEKVNDVTQIIEDYEKTVQLDKKEIAKKLQEEEEKSSEDSKKNTRKTSKKKKNK